MKKKYIVTEELKKLLWGCYPNKYMEEIERMEYLTVDSIIDTGIGKVSISFVEIRGGGYWSYSREFFEELSKNFMLPKGIMEVE